MGKSEQMIYKFIKGYSYNEPPQKLEDTKGDFQLTALKPILNMLISENGYKEIYDIGCGNGVIIDVLKKMRIFDKNEDFYYYGFDVKENIKTSINYAIDNDLIDKVRCLSLDKQWTINYTTPRIYIIRNVLHELTITEMVDLFYNIWENLNKDDVLLVQDMTILPVVEKKRVGWIGEHIKQILEVCGFNGIVVEDESKRGIQVYLLKMQKDKETYLTKEQLKEELLKRRKRQLGILREQYKIFDKTNEIGVARLSHDMSVLAELLNEKDIEEEKELASNLYNLAIITAIDEDVNTLKEKFNYNIIDYFQNRSATLLDIDDYIRNPEEQIFYLTGNKLIGKKSVIMAGLQKTNHNRLPLVIRLNSALDIIRIFEIIIEQLEVYKYIDVELLSDVQRFNRQGIFELIEKSNFSKLIEETILIFCEFETVIDPNFKIENKDVCKFIEYWCKNKKAKIIIESEVYTGDIEKYIYKKGRIQSFKAHENSKFGRYQYTVQMLQKLVPMEYRIEDEEHGGFPLELLELTENHPFLTYLISTIIRQSEINCLKDDKYINSLRAKLKTKTISCFQLNSTEEKLINILLQFKADLSLEVVNSLDEYKLEVESLIRKGLLVKTYANNYKLIKMFKDDKADDRNQYIAENNYISQIYNKLYENTSKPFYYRNKIYHEIKSGLVIQKKKSMLPEIAKCAEDAFKAKDYSGALDFLQYMKKNMVLSAKDRMRMASCHIRVGEFEVGRNMYKQLLEKEYPNWQALKHSYVDSLLYVNKNLEEGIKILKEIEEQDRSAYWYKQMAKCFRLLKKRKESYKNYESAILHSNGEEAAKVVIEFCNYAKEFADNNTQKTWLDYIWNELKDRSISIKIERGAFFERTNEPEEAYELLVDVYNEVRDDPYCILPLIKTLCRLGKHPEAATIIDDFLKVDRLAKNEILKYGQAFYYESIGEYPKAEQIINELIAKDPSNPHYWGQWAELYLFEAREIEDTEKRNKIVNIGLKYKENIIESKNVPSMITCKELALLINDNELVNKIQDIIVSLSLDIK